MEKESMKKVGEFFLIVVLCGGVFYSSTTAWKNEEKLSTIGGDIKSIKKSMIALLLDENIDKSAIARELITDASFLNDFQSFRSGHYRIAISNWARAAKNGDKEAAYAINAAHNVLKAKLLYQDEISELEKNKIETAISEISKIRDPS